VAVVNGSLAGRVVLVTGAAGGIGSAVARTVVAEGGTAIVHDVNAEAMADVAAELGEDAAALSSDLRDPVAVEQLWSRAFALHGRVDVLVNKRQCVFARAARVQPARLARCVGSHVGRQPRRPRSALPRGDRRVRVATRGGIIVNVTSVTAHRGALPDHWPYGAAKGGLASMTRTIARHYGRQGVTAFVVAPGFVDTPMSRTILDEDGFRAVADATGLGEVTQPQDVADVIAFLASGRARHATGTTIDVNAAGYCR
jgi:3-oxoacyl-[acyl-carrier protein] reductase